MYEQTIDNTELSNNRVRKDYDNSGRNRKNRDTAKKCKKKKNCTGKESNLTQGSKGLVSNALSTTPRMSCRGIDKT